MNANNTPNVIVSTQYKMMSNALFPLYFFINLILRVTMRSIYMLPHLQLTIAC